mgnify:CR=1 FL=1
MFRSVLIPLLAGFDVGLEVVADDSEARSLGRFDVTIAVSPGRVRVVHDKGLLGDDARIDEVLPTVPSLQHVQVDANMRIDEPILEEG